MKSIHRFLIAILLVTGFAGVSLAQRGPGDHGKGMGHHGNPDQLNLMDSCWQSFLSELPADSAQMLIDGLDCLKASRGQFDTLWHQLRSAHHAKDSAAVADLRAKLAALRAQRDSCGRLVKTILRQYASLIHQYRHDCGKHRPDPRDTSHHGPGSTDGIKLGMIVPNPVPTGQTTATLNYGIATDSHVVITISDQIGNVVKEVFNGDLTAGPQTQALDLTGLTPGMYYVRIQANGSVRTARLIIQ